MFDCPGRSQVRRQEGLQCSLAGALVIKGPSLQYDLRVKRQWKCPQCGRTVPSSGSVTSRQCFCTEAGVFMKLIDPPRTLPFDASAFVDADDLTRDTDDDGPDGLEEATASVLAAIADRMQNTVRRERRTYPSGLLDPVDALGSNAAVDPDARNIDEFAAGVSLDVPVDSQPPSFDTSAASFIEDAAVDEGLEPAESDADESTDLRPRRRRRRRSRGRGATSGHEATDDASEKTPEGSSRNEPDLERDDVPLTTDASASPEGESGAASSDRGPRRRNRRPRRRRTAADPHTPDSVPGDSPAQRDPDGTSPPRPE